MIEVCINDELTYTMPETWEEVMQHGKYLDVIKLLNTPYTSEAEARFAMFRYLCGLDGFAIGKTLGAGNEKERSILSGNLTVVGADAIVQEIFPSLDFIFTRQAFTKNPIPVFVHQKKTFRGPTDKLSNQTGEEWIITHHAQMLYHKTNDRKHLLDIVAANYHQEQDGKRKPFNDEQRDEDAAMLADLPDEIALGIYLWYQHADQWWTSIYPHLFSSDEGEKKKALTGLEVRHLLFELSKNSIGSDWDIVKTRPRQEIFITLDRLDEKRVEAEENSQQ